MGKIKISTITCHDVYNYGATLQAYALQEYCLSQGFDYEIINYKPRYLSNHYNLWSVNNPVYDKPVLKQLYLLANLPKRLRSLKRKRKFDEFTKNYLCLSRLCYDSNELLRSDYPCADVYIAGSDQIWNTFFPNGKDPAFYLDFVKNGGRKVSYAASFATDKIQGGYEAFVSEKLKNFDAISVRESTALRLLSELGRNDSQIVCDPVFLLTFDEWHRLLPQKEDNKEDYIFVYDCEKSSQLRDVAEELKRRTGLKLYAVSSTYGRYADKDMSLSGPIEFLKLLAGARYVVANSFHALAFAIIFKKDFFILNRSEKINTRMRDFLDYMNLSTRLIIGTEGLILEKIDYDKIENLKKSLVEDSKKFLVDQIIKSK